MSERRTVQRISSGAPWEGRFGYSRAVRSGGHIFVSGTVGINEDGTVPAGAHAQAVRALQIILDALKQLGAGPEHVVRTRTFVTDIAYFEDVARAHAAIFGDIRPATSLVAVTRLVDEAYLLEVEADAHLG